MLIKNLTLNNFRNYKKSSFQFDNTNVIIGKNTIGKTNILEGISFLSTGKSFKAEKDVDAIKIDEEFAKVSAKIIDGSDIINLEAIIANNTNRFSKKLLVNGLPKKQSDFISKLLTVIFTPQDIEIITDSPSLRRNYISNILLQANKTYRNSLSVYEKALKQRNRLLDDIKDGKRNYKADEFEYWNILLIENGAIITKERENLVNFINKSKKDIFDLTIAYDKSTITQERIDKYHNAEIASGLTLIGPQRDDFLILFLNPPLKRSLSRSSNELRQKVSLGGPNNPNLPNHLTSSWNGGVATTTTPSRWHRTIKEFGSRGEQRLTILQLKKLEIEFIKQATEKTPILLLDDIFSELDNKNIQKVLELINECQTITTTTHKEFIPKSLLPHLHLIELK
ncbi:DNA replication and repair protein RecF [Candidatus Parcubacteria bacterium]|nr:MAG: DNA replication and repair protein RecF [Candidatus Parcubacteria bacterium]